MKLRLDADNKSSETEQCKEECILLKSMSEMKRRMMSKREAESPW